MKKKIKQESNKYNTAGTSFQFFLRGGKILTDYLGGNMKKTKFCVQKHRKLLFFKFRGGKHLLPPPPSDAPAVR